MSEIIVSTFTIPNYETGDSTAKLRIWNVKKNFVTSDGKVIVEDGYGAASFYQEISCTATAGVITVPQFTIDSTTDSYPNPNIRPYSAAIVDTHGEIVRPLFRKWQVPTSLGTTVTYTDLEIYNNDVLPYQPGAAETNAYSEAQSDARFVHKSGDTMTGDLIVPAEVYGSAWNGSNEVPTKNDVYDKLETIASGGVGSLFFDAVKLQNVNCGVFWRPQINYSHFFWEFWIKPVIGNGAWTGYFLSDNHGGAHNLLIGVQMGSTGDYRITGNVWDGSVRSFDTTETFKSDEWHCFAVGWDGTDLLLWCDGVLLDVITWPYSRFQGGGNNNTLHLGGSDHSNYWGYIAQVRGYEGYGRCPWNTDYLPERYFRPGYWTDTGLVTDMPQFAMSFARPAFQYLDIGTGFEGVQHHGVAEAQQSVEGAGVQAPACNDLDPPTFVPGAMTFGDVARTAPAMPAGAKVWDSFSRVDATPFTKQLAAPYDNLPSIGSTEGGSLGALPWGITGLQTFAHSTGGILNGRHFFPYQNANICVETGLSDVDIQVDRVNNHPSCFAAILLRYKDDNNYYVIEANDSTGFLVKVEAGVTTNIGFTPGTGWKTLRAVASGTALSIYTGTGTLGVFTLKDGARTITNVSGNTKHGIYNTNTVAKRIQRTEQFTIF